MSLFALGDPHLSLGADKPMDIFPGWNDYVTRMEHGWRALVKEDDTVVLPGDISWAMSLERTKADFAFLNSLPGQKILLKGNHDYWWSTRKKMDAFLEENGFSTLSILHNNAYRIGDFTVCGSRGWFFDAETDADKKVLLREAGRLRMSIAAGKQLGGTLLVFLHYPPVSTLQTCDELMQVLKEEGVTRCYYGHLHGASRFNAVIGPYDGIDFSLVSADHLGFCPKIIEKF